MNTGRILPACLFIAAAISAQSCVEYLPENDGPAGSAQEPAPPAQAAAESPGQPPSPPPAVPETDTERLLAPIALYPDPLIALILPASTVPGDVRAAAGYLVQYADASQLDSQPWDPSVRALAHYPTIITWMADNPDWTQALGAAFTASPADVMAAIQSLRARAVATGALASTPQQQVSSQDGDIEILPAQADEVFVPSYDPTVVYSGYYYGGYGGPFLTFGDPCPAGPWLAYDFDWRRREFLEDGPDAWRGPGGWRRPHSGDDRGEHKDRRWHPPAGTPRPQPGPGRPVPLPHKMPGAPATPARPGRDFAPQPGARQAPPPGISVPRGPGSPQNPARVAPSQPPTVGSQPQPRDRARPAPAGPAPEPPAQRQEPGERRSVPEGPRSVPALPPARDREPVPASRGAPQPPSSRPEPAHSPAPRTAPAEQPAPRTDPKQDQNPNR